MPQYAKVNDIAIIATGLGTDFPAPSDYVTDFYSPKIGFNAPPLATGFANADTLQAYGYSPGVNWGAIETTDLGFPAIDFPWAVSQWSGGTVTALGVNHIGTVNPDICFTGVEYTISLDGSQQIGVVPVNAGTVTFTPATTVQIGTGSSYCWYNGSPALLNLCRYDNTFVGNYIVMGVYNAGIWTMANCAHTTTNLSAEFLHGVFGAAPPYKLILDDLQFVYEVEFTPEAFGGDNQSGTFTNTEPDVITFDDPVIDALFAAGMRIGDYDFSTATSDFIAFGDGDDLILVEIMPASQTYNVISVAGFFLIETALYDAGYAYVYSAYDSGSSTFTLYGLGPPAAPSEPITVPIFTAVKLPCIVNCVPLIDRRF